MRPFKKYVTSIIAFSTWFTFVNFTLPLPLCYSLKIRNYRMREKKIFCIYGCFSLSRYIKGGRNHIFRHERIFRYTCINNTHWQGGGIEIFLCKYFRYTDRPFLGCVILLLIVMISEHYEKSRRKDWVIEKKYIEEFVRGTSLFWQYSLLSMSFFLAFFVYSIPFPKWRTC